ncbi:MAG: guaA 1, partial [Firmicutes bacterium]|nr:guaA 1 [Bacillota bacterium]
ESIDSLLHYCADDLKGGAYVQSERQIQARMSFLKSANSLMDEFLDRLEELT